MSYGDDLVAGQPGDPWFRDQEGQRHLHAPECWCEPEEDPHAPGVYLHFLRRDRLPRDAG